MPFLTVTPEIKFVSALYPLNHIVRLNNKLNIWLLPKNTRPVHYKDRKFNAVREIISIRESMKDIYTYFFF